MSRASQASSSTARLSLATGINGTEASTSTTPSGNTLGVRQRIERVPSQSLLVTPTSNHVKKRPSREAGYGSLKGKEKENVSTSARTHGPSRRKWEVGSRGWVKEGFRQFGEHCARNQVKLPRSFGADVSDPDPANRLPRHDESILPLACDIPPQAQSRLVVPEVLSSAFSRESRQTGTQSTRDPSSPFIAQPALAGYLLPIPCPVATPLILGGVVGRGNARRHT